MGCGTHVLVADVNPVDFYACSSAEAATERHGREAVLRGIESAAILDLDSGLELSQIEEVTPVDGQVFDLFRRQNPLHRSLFRVDGDLVALHLHNLGTLPHRKLQISRGGGVHLHNHRKVD